MRVLRIPSAAVGALGSIAAGVLLGAVTVRSQDRLATRQQVFAEALGAIEADYVEPLLTTCPTPEPCGAEALVYNSIEGMLRTLDPHSTFFNPRDFRALRERQEGHYAGI